MSGKPLTVLWAYQLAMASESTGEGTVAVSLPAELDDWLDERAAALDTDRETVLVQLLASYRATAELDSDVEPQERIPIAEAQTVEEMVTSVLAEHLDDRVESAVQAQIQASVQSLIDDRVGDVEADYMEKITDLRERVVQLKRELDEKAVTDHDHEAFDHIDEVETRLGELEAAVDRIETDVETRLGDQETETEEIKAQLDSVQERLKTVAWVVKDLREAREGDSGVESVERIKRAAAKINVDHAKCENCSNTVSVGLLTEPNCPHCDATVTNVEAASGFFSKPRLLTASQLEAGERE